MFDAEEGAVKEGMNKQGQTVEQTKKRKNTGKKGFTRFLSVLYISELFVIIQLELKHHILISL